MTVKQRKKKVPSSRPPDISVTILDVQEGCVPVSCTIKAPNEASVTVVSKMMDRLLNASLFTWLSEQSLFHVVKGKPEILHFFNDGLVTRELMASRGQRGTPLTCITSSAL